MKNILIFAALFATNLCGGAQTKIKPNPVKTTKAVAETCKKGEKDPIWAWSCNGFGYCPPPDPKICKNGAWVVDMEEVKIRRAEQDEVERKQAVIEKHHSDLWNALRTRVIADSEMKEVLEIGAGIVPQKDGGLPPERAYMFDTESESWQQSRLQIAETIFQDALLLQFKLRLASKN